MMKKKKPITVISEGKTRKIFDPCLYDQNRLSILQFLLTCYVNFI